jgi:hypothetical protein
MARILSEQSEVVHFAGVRHFGETHPPKTRAWQTAQSALIWGIIAVITTIRLAGVIELGEVGL